MKAALLIIALALVELSLAYSCWEVDYNMCPQAGFHCYTDGICGACKSPPTLDPNQQCWPDPNADESIGEINYKTDDYTSTFKYACCVFVTEASKKAALDATKIQKPAAQNLRAPQ